MLMSRKRCSESSKESGAEKGIDLCLYTRGGDTNSVWPLVSLIREFDPDFQVLAPFRCHSSGTLVALGAARVVMGPLSELSPIDPSTVNQFNPRDPLEPGARLAISVEDVHAYKTFIGEQFCDPAQDDAIPFKHLAETHLQPFVERLTTKVHPLALGNVQRVLMQIQQLATNLLQLHSAADENISAIVEALTTRFYSHLHMINRHEAKEILGVRIEFAEPNLAAVLDRLLRAYEDSFRLRQKFFLNSYLAGMQETNVRFIGGVVESRAWSYLFETKATIRQHVSIPANVQIQVPFGQSMPLIPGLPRQTEVEITAQSWMHNVEPLGVTT